MILCIPCKRADRRPRGAHTITDCEQPVTCTCQHRSQDPNPGRTAAERSAR